MGVYLSTLPIYPPGSRSKRGPRTTRRAIDAAARERQLFLNNLPSHLLSLILGASPSIFDKSPSEHEVDVAAAHARIPPLKRKYFEQLKPEVPPGHVRVRFFTSLKALWENDMKPNLEAILPLEANGEFDLKRIKTIWGLETCAPIDPVRWKVVEPVRPDMLSPVAVYNLLQVYDAINFTEPTVSKTTLRKRALRDQVKPHVEHLRPTVDAVVSRAHKFANATSLAEYYDRAQQDVSYLVRCFETWAAELSSWQKALLVMIFFSLIVLYFVVSQLGPHTVKAPTRLRWARANVDLATE